MRPADRCRTHLIFITTKFVGFPSCPERISGCRKVVSTDVIHPIKAFASRPTILFPPSAVDARRAHAGAVDLRPARFPHWPGLRCRFNMFLLQQRIASLSQTSAGVQTQSPLRWQKVETRDSSFCGSIASGLQKDSRATDSGGIWRLCMKDVAGLRLLMVSRW